MGLEPLGQPGDQRPVAKNMERREASNILPSTSNKQVRPSKSTMALCKRKDRTLPQATKGSETAARVGPGPMAVVQFNTFSPEALPSMQAARTHIMLGSQSELTRAD